MCSPVPKLHHHLHIPKIIPLFSLHILHKILQKSRLLFLAIIQNNSVTAFELSSGFSLTAVNRQCNSCGFESLTQASSNVNGFPKTFKLLSTFISSLILVTVQ